MVWRSTWDSPTDAAEFADALTRYDEQRFRAERRAGASENASVIATNDQVSIVTIAGDEVTYVLAPDEATAESLLTASDT